MFLQRMWFLQVGEEAQLDTNFSNAIKLQQKTMFYALYNQGAIGI